MKRKERKGGRKEGRKEERKKERKKEKAPHAQTRQLLPKTKAEREAQMKGLGQNDNNKKYAGKEEGKFKENARRFRLRALRSSLISSSTG